MICLTRGLCEAPGLSELHVPSSHALKALTHSSYMRGLLGLESLYLWTFCSRQRFSSAILMENSGHILIDGFQTDALFYLFQALTLTQDNGALAIMLPAMLSEDYINANDVGMADALMNTSIAGARRFPGVLSELYGDLRFQREVQRIFIIGHEIGHLILANSTPAQREEWTPVMQLRLEHTIRFLLGGKQDVPPDAWTLRGDDAKFRDELFCDTLALEMVEVALAQLGNKPADWQRLAFETIYFTAFALDLLRTLKRVAGSGADSFDVVVQDALLGREFIRSVSLNLMAQARFEVTKVFVESILERVKRAQQSEFGLLHVLSIAEYHRQHVSSDVRVDGQRKARLYSLYKWRLDPRAVFQDQIF